MEEVDRIIIHALKQIGCEIDDEVQSLKGFSVDMVIEATARCLRLVTPGLDVPLHLPDAMSARFRLGSSLAQYCQDLGYQGELGYQTFLYFGDTDIRRIFMFLIEKLPKDTEKLVDQPLGASARLSQLISSTLSQQLRASWLPPVFRTSSVTYSDESILRLGNKKTSNVLTVPLSVPTNYKDSTSNVPKEVRKYYRDHLPLVACQSSSCLTVAASVLETNVLHSATALEMETEYNQNALTTRLSLQEYKSRKKQKIDKRVLEAVNQELGRVSSDGSGLLQSAQLADIIDKFSGREGEGQGFGSRFTHSQNLQFKQEPSKIPISDPVVSLRAEQAADIESRREEELTTSRAQLEDVTTRLDQLQFDVKKITASVQSMQEQLQTLEQKNQEAGTILHVKQTTLALLPEADVNLGKLQAVIDSSSQRLLKLAGQWEEMRLPIIEEYRQLKQLNASRLSETQRKVEEIRAILTKMRELAEEARNKEELHKQLISEYERTTKDMNRSAYTRRILEIVTNIKKQKEDIDKVIMDTKEIQKDINQLTGKRDRTFTETDEVIFKDAKKDEAVRKAYKHLAALHESCRYLIQTVKETGAIMREIRDLEDQLENERQKKVMDNLERIMADYKQMKQENETLLAKLKERQAK